MNILRTAALAITILGAPVTHAENITVNYQYSGADNVDLSAMTAGSISVAEFSDAREVDAHIVTLDGSQYQLDQPLTDIVQDAFVQAFEQSGAAMADNPNLVFSGEITQFSASRTENGIELIMRSNVALDNQGRNTWQGGLFSRVESESDDLGQALENGLDRLIRELLWDNYFTMELGIF